ncbi:hypothetical protein, partial [Nocardia salmonicida]|uniref:hypothetical protein n=1 Tax=Nocardia salmonicida TaxID=53431 RepID=UPI0034045641
MSTIVYLNRAQFAERIGVKPPTLASRCPDRFAAGFLRPSTLGTPSVLVAVLALIWRAETARCRGRAMTPAHRGR